MDSRILLGLSILWFSLLLESTPAFAAELTRQPDLEMVGEFRLDQPQVLAARVNDLFRGSKVPHPAAALSAWKRATRGDDRLGKPLEAAIAFFNPEMAREWRCLDGATLKFWVESPPEPARPSGLDWSLVVPNDDGTVAAFLTAGRLTGGAEENNPPVKPGLAIHRAGSAGAPVFAMDGKGLVVAGSRRSLNRALVDLKSLPPADSRIAPMPPAISFKINARLPAAWLGDSAWSPQIAELNQTLEAREIEGSATIEADAARVRFRSRGGKPGPSPLLHARPIDRAWLRWVPGSGVLAASIVRFDPAPTTWNSLFNLVDRVEKSDPAKAGTVPVRLRFNMLLGAARVQPEVDLWPHLEGMTICFVDAQNRGDSSAETLLALHADGEPSARQLQEQFAPRIAEAYLPKSGRPIASPKSGVQKLGDLNNRPFFLARDGRTVLLSWGGKEAISESLKQAAGEPDPSNMAALTSPTASRLSLFWPGRLMFQGAGLDPKSPTGRVLANARPIVWSGDVNPERSQIDDSVAWTGLHALIDAFLNSIPLDPPNP